MASLLPSDYHALTRVEDRENGATRGPRNPADQFDTLIFIPDERVNETRSHSNYYGNVSISDD